MSAKQHPSGVWAELDRLAKEGKTPVLRIDSTPVPLPKLPNGRPRVSDPEKPFAHYKTRWMHGKHGVQCVGGCGNLLKRYDVLFCSQECREHVAKKAQFILDAIANPPETVYIDLLRNGFIKENKRHVGVATGGSGGPSRVDRSGDERRESTTGPRAARKQPLHHRTGT